MLSCKDITRLVSEGLDRQLPLRQRIGVRLHLFLCRFCARFRSHLLFLRRAVRQHRHALEEAGPAEGPVLSPAARERMKRLLQQGSA
jgi:hypothetical protein